MLLARGAGARYRRRMFSEDNALVAWLQSSNNHPSGGLPWFVGLALLLLVVGTLMLLRHLVIRRLAPMAARTEQIWDDFLVDLTRRTMRPFIWTVGIAAAAVVWPLPEKWAHRLDVLLVLVLTAQVGIWGTGLVEYAALALVHHRAPRDVASYQSIRNLVRTIGLVLVWASVALVALENLGVEVTTLVAGLGFTGLAVTFATQNIFRDLFSSFSIVVDQPFLVGDFINVGGGIVGTVERIGIKSTRIRSLSGEEVICSNSDLVETRIQNFRTLQQRRVAFTLGLRSGVPASQCDVAVDIIRAVVRETPDVRLDRAHLCNLDQGVLNYEIVYYVNGPDYTFYMDRHHHILTTMLQRLDAVQMHLAFPTRLVAQV